jgi:hypothetical protein
MLQEGLLVLNPERQIEVLILENALAGRMFLLGERKVAADGLQKVKSRGCGQHLLSKPTTIHHELGRQQDAG